MISPACQRAVLETVDALRKAGHECIEFNPAMGVCCASSWNIDTHPPLAVDIMVLFVSLASSDGYQSLLQYLLGDPRVRTTRLFHLYIGS